MTRFRALLLWLGALALASLLVGCGGGNPPPATATPLVVDGMPIGTPTDLLSYRYRVDIQSNTDLIDTSQAPPGLDLSEFVLDLEIEGERVNPDREWTRSRTDFGYYQVDRETIVIGSENWTREGSGIWRQNLPLAAPEDFLGQDVALTPATILDPGSPDALRRMATVLATTPFTLETVNGRQTRHWVLNDDDIARMIDPADSTLPGVLPPTSTRLELWADVETGIGVRLLLTAASATSDRAFVLQIDLYDFNDPSINIDEPEGVLNP